MNRADEKFTTFFARKFFREPSRPDRRLHDALLDKEDGVRPSLSLLSFWGVHSKPRLDAYDERAFAFLGDLVAYVADHLGTEVKLDLLVTDVHARVNEVPEHKCREYASQVESAARLQDWQVARLSHLWERNGLEWDSLDAELVDLESIPNLKQMLEYSKSHFLGSDHLLGLRRYVTARLLEKSTIETQYSTHVFASSANDDMAFLQPDLPIFRVWSMHRKRSVKPWFIREPGTVAHQAAR